MSDITINFVENPSPVNVTITGAVGGDVTPVGSRISGYWATAPAGYVLAKGETIGSATSGADYTANTEPLFTLLWNNVSNAYCPVSGGRGANAAADFAANKTLTLPDERLRVPVMRDSGQTLAGLTADMGAVGGEQTHQLLTTELPNFASSLAQSGFGVAALVGYFQPGDAHNNVQPFVCVNVAIKL